MISKAIQHGRDWCIFSDANYKLFIAKVSQNSIDPLLEDKWALQHWPVDGGVCSQQRQLNLHTVPLDDSASCTEAL
jgi:hypothetical protein